MKERAKTICEQGPFHVFHVSRRRFVGGVLAFGAAGGPRLVAAGADAQERVPPRLRFGVMSDVHIGGKPDAEATLEKTLRWFASENVDAVLCAGDIAHSGLIGEMEKFAAVWHKVFPGGLAPDGRKVELMISTGNHDVDAWGGRWKNFTPEQLRAKRICYEDNAEKTWQRLFGQKWDIIWRREVKGYAVVQSQAADREIHEGPCAGVRLVQAVLLLPARASRGDVPRSQRDGRQPR